MHIEPRLEIVGAALSDASRVRMLCELMDGRSHTGKELASAAGIAPNTASEHLSKLLNANMIVAKKSGRCVYYRIASDEIAEILEQMSALSPTDHLYRGRCRGRYPELVARTCYNHIAGRLGVLIAQGLIARGWVYADGENARLTQSGGNYLTRIGVLHDGEPTLAIKCCLDWSERRHHFSGPFGTRLFDHAIAQNWLSRPQYGRTLQIKPKGVAAFEQHFGISNSALCCEAGAT